MKKLLYGIALSTFFIALAHAQETCQLPSSIPKPSLQGVDCKNIRTPDYYALALSWSPQHCATHQGASHKFQCQDNQFGFVVHGLWGQENDGRGKCGHPRNCGKSLVDEETIRETLCIVPSVKLIQDEWQKHGTCTSFKTPREYFGQIRELWGQLTKPDIRRLANEKGNALTAGDVATAFVQANAARRLSEQSVVVHVGSGNFLSELLVCYDLNFHPTVCRVGRTPSTQKIRVAQ
jgi:ribonuclease T2